MAFHAPTVTDDNLKDEFLKWVDHMYALEMFVFLYFI